MEKVFLEPVLFQPWLMDNTFHSHLPVEIMQEPLPKCPLSWIFLQELCALLTSHSHHLAFLQIDCEGIFPSPRPSAKIFRVGIFLIHWANRRYTVAKKKKIEVRNEYQERRNGIIKPIDTRMASIYMLYLMLFKFLILCTHVSTRAESPRSQMLVLPDFTCLSISLILLKIFIFKNSLLL